jgi:DNA-binding transcriptional LysR family regulator
MFLTLRKDEAPMARKIDWDAQIGRRLKLRDLHVFFTVVQRRSMAKAAEHLRVSQSAVSEVIANLEYALGVRLLDRGPRGVEPTIYGNALLKRGTAAFDELKQSIKDIEYLADPTTGEVRIACPESLASGILPPIIAQFTQQNPGVVLHVDSAVTSTLELPALRERTADVVLARICEPITNASDDLDVEVLFDDVLVVAAGIRSRWAGRAKIAPSELANVPWIMTPPGMATALIAEAFEGIGLSPPRASLVTYSIPLRAHLAASSEFITVLPHSVLQLNADLFSLQALPVELPIRPWPVAAVKLKNRTLSPAARRFIDHVRAFTSPLREEMAREKQAKLGGRVMDRIAADRA